jgi:serine/threonine protein kinase
MEYLDGLDLEELVLRDGPLPEGRVIHILAQLCGSLAEAHAAGLIHRDIKPANIVINRRGGLYDFVKVLDFGLVKALDSEREATLTAANAITGTPLYMSPEAIEQPDAVDARSDLYAVGAVGYFLLTGTAVFRGQSILEILRLQATASPESPSLRLGRPIADDLQQVILSCLAKSPSSRPASATALGDALTACRSAGEWRQRHAQAWWENFERTGPFASTSPTAVSFEASTLVPGQTP